MLQAHGASGYAIMNKCLRMARKELNARGHGPLIRYARGHKRKSKAGSPGPVSKKKKKR